VGSVKCDFEVGFFEILISKYQNIKNSISHFPPPTSKIPTHSFKFGEVKDPDPNNAT